MVKLARSRALRVHVYGLMTLCLAACGGGGGGSGALPSGVTSITKPAAPPPATASPGASASPSHSSTPPATASPAATATPTALPTTTAPPTSAPLSAGPAHIATYAFDENGGQGTFATAQQVRTYVTYAESGDGNAKAQTDCNTAPKACQSVFYFDPNIVYENAACPDYVDGPLIAAAAENWFVHETGYADAAHRVSGAYQTTCHGAPSVSTVWSLNTAQSAVQAWYLAYLQSRGDGFDVYRMDNTSGTVVDQFYGPGGGFCNGLCYSTQEYTTNAQVVAAHAAFVTALHHVNGSAMRIIFNGLSFDGAPVANDLSIFGSSPEFIGAGCENCIVNAGALQPANYVRLLNSMAAINVLPSGMTLVMSSAPSSIGTQAQDAARLVTTAVVWLGYAEGRTIVWPDLEDDTTNLAVWPEDQLYPSSPVQSMVAGASDLAVSPNVWRREFAVCYNGGTPIGPCASVVNAGATAIAVSTAWLTQKYAHQVAFSGGDVLSGGAVSLSSTAFTAGSSVVGPGQALLLVR